MFEAFVQRFLNYIDLLRFSFLWIYYFRPSLHLRLYEIARGSVAGIDHDGSIYGSFLLHNIRAGS
jgi:hypothetical protein